MSWAMALPAAPNATTPLNKMVDINLIRNLPLLMGAHIVGYRSQFDRAT
jgi:hypothetical protein